MSKKKMERTLIECLSLTFDKALYPVTEEEEKVRIGMFTLHSHYRLKERVGITMDEAVRDLFHSVNGDVYRHGKSFHILGKKAFYIITKDTMRIKTVLPLSDFSIARKYGVKVSKGVKRGIRDRIRARIF